MAVLIAMLIVSSTGSVATIPGWRELSGCEAAIGEVSNYFRAHGAEVFAVCEVLPPVRKSTADASAPSEAPAMRSGRSLPYTLPGTAPVVPGFLGEAE